MHGMRSGTACGNGHVTGATEVDMSADMAARTVAPAGRAAWIGRA